MSKKEILMEVFDVNDKKRILEYWVETSKADGAKEFFEKHTSDFIDSTLIFLSDYMKDLWKKELSEDDMVKFTEMLIKHNLNLLSWMFLGNKVSKKASSYTEVSIRDVDEDEYFKIKIKDISDLNPEKVVREFEEHMNKKGVSLTLKEREELIEKTNEFKVR